MAFLSYSPGSRDRNPHHNRRPSVRMRSSRTRIKLSPQLALLITFEEFPAAVVKDVAKTLGQSVRGAAKMQSGAVISESNTSQDGYPARTYEIDCGTVIYQGRYVLAGRRLYNIAAFVSKKLETPQPKELKTFFDSFQISK